MQETYERVFRAFPDVHVTAEHIVAQGDHLVVEWTFTGTMKGAFAGRSPTGNRFHFRGCEVFEVEGGKIRAQRGYWDKATLFNQLGI